MPPTLKQLALRCLREKIGRGELPPGARLGEIALAQELGISRTPVREAINQLASEGLVELTPHAGAFVRRPSREEIAEIYELREVLESHAAAKAAVAPDRATKAQGLDDACRRLRELRKSVKGKKAELTPEQRQEQIAADLDFHFTLLALAGNRRLERMIREFRILDRAMAPHSGAVGAEVLDSALECHEAVRQAVAAGDSAAAAAAMRSHIRRGLEETLRRFDAWDKEHPLPGVPEALREYV